jgi:ATP:ADP antiporter, AAA family
MPWLTVDGSSVIIAVQKPGKELGKFILLALIMAMQIYVLHILKNAKDTIIITQIGAEIISTLELFGILPSIVLFSLVYTKLTDRFTITQIFYSLNCSFAGFFILFGFFLYPHAKTIHFDLSALITSLPFLKYPLLMMANWSYSLFYVMAELWGTVMLSLMFWLVANQISSVDEAKKYYPLFGLIGEFGLILSGALMTVFTLSTVASDWATTLNYICGSVFIMILLINWGFYFLSKLVGVEVINKPYLRVHTNLNLKQSIYHVCSSKYIRLIALMLFCYGVSINLTETLWKKQLSVLYPHSLDYGHFIAKVQILIGITTLSAILLSSFVLRKLSWYHAALITPIIFILTGLPFFIGIFLSEGIFSIDFAYLALFISVIFGSAQHIFAKAMKYSFFEPTKEILYIPLSEELKTKGKGVADLLGERFGKSFGSVIQLGMLSIITGSTLLSFAPILFMVFLLFIITWFYSLRAINKELKKNA